MAREKGKKDERRLAVNVEKGAEWRLDIGL